MIKKNVTTTIPSNSNRKPVLLRDAGRVLKVNTGLKAGVQKVREA